jgi:DNA-directed RNA polymerase subunit RPC12/RpoP
MDVECPYCSATVDVMGLESHVRLFDGDGHGDYGSIPVDGVDNPWQLRLDFSGAPDPSDHLDDVPPVDLAIDRSANGRCPSCDRGPLGLKGGSGWLSSGPRRLACQHCGWESPEWLRIRE